MAPRARETAGTTISLIVRYVRAHAGDDGVARLLAAAGETRSVSELEDERRWSTYEEKVALLEGAATVLADPDIALHLGENALQHQVGPGIRLLLRRLGSPRVVLANVAKACPKFSTVATMTTEVLANDHAVVTYRLDEGKTPHRLDCQLNIGFMRTIGPIFGEPPLTVTHEECQVLGAPECRYLVQWTPTRGRRRREAGRQRALAHQVVELQAQVELLQSTTADLVSPDSIDDVLSRIVERAGTSVSATRYLLALYPDGVADARVHADGIADEEIDRAADSVLRAPLGITDGQIVIEVASSRRRYGRLAAFYDHHSFFAAEAGMLEAYARNAAAALDAATALEELRRRNRATDALLGLARSLAEPSHPRRIARTVASAMTEILDVPATAVLLRDDGEELRVAGRSGWPAVDGRAIDGLRLSLDRHPGIRALLDADGPTVVDGPAFGSDVAAALAAVAATTLAVAPVRAHHHGAYGLAIAAIPETRRGEVSTVLERLVAIGDQAATALQNAELLEQIRHQAVHDPLTGLANRTLFDAELAKTLARARRDRSAVTVLFIDLDDFKSVNDRFGHGAGDHVLRSVGTRLVTAGREGDSVARLGGDEFTMLLPGTTPADAQRVADRVAAAVREPITLGTDTVIINASVGIASSADGDDDADGLVRDADRSMYAAKRDGRIPTIVGPADPASAPTHSSPRS